MDQQQHTSVDDLTQPDDLQGQTFGSSDRAGGRMQHPVWLALDEVTDPVSRVLLGSSC